MKFKDFLGQELNEDVLSSLQRTTGITKMIWFVSASTK